MLRVLNKRQIRFERLTDSVCLNLTETPDSENMFSVIKPVLSAVYGIETSVGTTKCSVQGFRQLLDFLTELLGQKSRNS